MNAWQWPAEIRCSFGFAAACEEARDRQSCPQSTRSWLGYSGISQKQLFQRRLSPASTNTSWQPLHHWHVSLESLYYDMSTWPLCWHIGIHTAAIQAVVPRHNLLVGVLLGTTSQGVFGEAASTAFVVGLFVTSWLPILRLESRFHSWQWFLRSSHDVSGLHGSNDQHRAPKEGPVEEEQKQNRRLQCCNVAKPILDSATTPGLNNTASYLGRNTTLTTMKWAAFTGTMIDCESTGESVIRWLRFFISMAIRPEVRI